MAMTYFGAEKIFNHAAEMNQVADQPIHAFHSSVSRWNSKQEECSTWNTPRTILTWRRGSEADIDSYVPRGTSKHVRYPGALKSA